MFIVNPFEKAINVVKNASLVVVLTGAIGLEAAIVGKPVITFGQVPYNILPTFMVKELTSVTTIGSEILELLENYSYNASAIEQYLAAVIAGSVPVDLYTVLLAKPGRYNESTGLKENDTCQEQYGKLARYFMERLRGLTAQRMVAGR